MLRMVWSVGQADRISSATNLPLLDAITGSESLHVDCMLALTSLFAPMRPSQLDERLAQRSHRV